MSVVDGIRAALLATCDQEENFRHGQVNAKSTQTGDHSLHGVRGESGRLRDHDRTAFGC